MGADDLDRFGETTALALPPVPNGIYVRWAGQDDWVAVPIT